MLRASFCGRMSCCQLLLYGCVCCFGSNEWGLRQFPSWGVERPWRRPSSRHEKRKESLGHSVSGSAARSQNPLEDASGRMLRSPLLPPLPLLLLSLARLRLSSTILLLLLLLVSSPRYTPPSHRRGDHTASSWTLFTPPAPRVSRPSLTPSATTYKNQPCPASEGARGTTTYMSLAYLSHPPRAEGTVPPIAAAEPSQGCPTRIQVCHPRQRAAPRLNHLIPTEHDAQLTSS